MSYTTSSGLMGFISLILIVLFAGGWVANIYKIFTLGIELSAWGGMEIMRVIGIFIAPLGAVLGFL